MVEKFFPTPEIYQLIEDRKWGYAEDCREKGLDPNDLENLKDYLFFLIVRLEETVNIHRKCLDDLNNRVMRLEKIRNLNVVT